MTPARIPVPHRLPLLFLPLLASLANASPPPADWDGLDAALARIEAIRMQDFAIQVLDPDGKPLPGSRVQVEMLRHSFQFGSAINVWAFTENGPNPEASRYLDVFKSNFNAAVAENAMKWYGMNHPDGRPKTENRAKFQRAMEWLDEQNIDLRGHAVLWPSWRFSPDYLHELRLDPKAIESEVNARIDEAVTLFKGKLTDWDLVNEPVHHRDIINILGEDVVAEWYARAHEIDPHTPMYVNQWAIFNDVYHEGFLKWVERLVNDPAASLDGIGIQGHGTVELYLESDKIDSVWKKLNQYAAFELPIKITEFDIEGYKGEDLQAQALENALTLFFSHPSIEGFMIWGFWDGTHWRNSPNWSFTGDNEQAGFWRENWTEKPAAKVWRKLIYEKWWTDLTGYTDANEGTFSGRGYLGTYRITVTHQNKSVSKIWTLGKDNRQLEIRLAQESDRSAL